MLVHAFICLFIHLIRVGRVPPTRHDSGQECTQMAGPSTLQGLEGLVSCPGLCGWWGALHDCNSSGDSGGPLRPGFPSHWTLWLCLSLFSCVTQTWTKQDKHGALNFQLIANLLRVAEEGFGFIFSQSRSQEKGHRGFRTVGLRGGQRFSFHTCQARNGQETAWTRGGEKWLQDMTAPPERGSAQPSTCSVSCSRLYTLILCVQKSTDESWETCKVDNHPLLMTWSNFLDCS